MADQLLKQAQDLLEGQIVRFRCPITFRVMLTDQIQDFEGQKTAELLSTILLAVSGVSAQILPQALRRS